MLQQECSVFMGENMKLNEIYYEEFLNRAEELEAVEQEIGGVKISPEYLAVMATINNSEKMNIDGQSFIDVTESLKKSGITDMKDVSDYFEHKGNADPIKTGEALTEAFGHLDGVDDPYKKIDEIDKVLNME